MIRAESIRTALAATLFGVAAALLQGCSASTQLAPYSAKVRFRENQPIRFADFELTYIGHRHVASSRYPRGFDYQDFRVSATETQTVSWSAGTGLIDPADFKVDRVPYNLELVRSEKLGPLRRDELVINRLTK